LVDLNTNESIPLAAVRSKIDDLSQNDLPRYDSLRRSVGLGLGSLVAIVFGLNVCGICLGFCGYKREATPTNRGGASNIGGMCLMLSVFVSFLTGWILMLLTTTTFAIGGHAERYMCQTLQEDPSSGNFTGLQVNIKTNIYGVLNIEIQFLYELGSSMGYNYPGDLLRPINRTELNSTVQPFIVDPNYYFS